MKRAVILRAAVLPVLLGVWSCASVPPPEPTVFPPAPSPSVLVQQLEPTLALQPLRWDLLKTTVPPELSDDLQLVRVTFAQQRNDDAILEPSYTLHAASGERSYPLNLTLLAHYTREKVPERIREERLRGAGFPLLLNVLTMGILEGLTLHREVSTRAPKDEDLRQAAPRAMALRDELLALAGRRGQQVLLLPRRELPWRLTVTLRSVALHRTAPGDPPAAAAEDTPQVRIAILAQSEAIARGEAPYDGTARPFLSFAALASREPPTEQNKVMPAPWVHSRPAVSTPAHLATPTENEKARPEWAANEQAMPKDVSAKLVPLAGFVPLPGGAVSDGILRCELAPDIGAAWAEVKLPRRKMYDAGLYGRHVLVPLLSLQSGDDIELLARARTERQLLFFGNNPYTIAALRGRYTGQLPLTLRDRRRQVQCDVLPRQATEAIVEESLDSLWKWLDEIQIAPQLPAPWPLRPDERDWGFRGSVVVGAREVISRHAALVGWADARLGPHLARLAYLTELYRRHIRAFVAEQGRGGKELTFKHILTKEQSTIAVRLVGPHCGDAARAAVGVPWGTLPAERCVFELELTHREGLHAQLLHRDNEFCDLTNFRLLWEDGSAVALTPIGRDHLTKKESASGCPLAPGASTHLYLMPQAPRPAHSALGEPSITPSTPPVLLQFRAYGNHDALYLRL